MTASAAPALLSNGAYIDGPHAAVEAEMTTLFFARDKARSAAH